MYWRNKTPRYYTGVEDGTTEKKNLFGYLISDYFILYRIILYRIILTIVNNLLKE